MKNSGGGEGLEMWGTRNWLGGEGGIYIQLKGQHEEESQGRKIQWRITMKEQRKKIQRRYKETKQIPGPTCRGKSKSGERRPHEGQEWRKRTSAI